MKARRARMTLCNSTRFPRERASRDACSSAPPKQMFPRPTPAGIAVTIYGATMRRTKVAHFGPVADAPVRAGDPRADHVAAFVERGLVS
jgi:hypothetical protein